MVTRAIKSAQTQVEQQNFEIRKNVLKYDEVMNQQRKVIYAERRRILEGENLQQQAHDMLVDVVTAYVNGATAEGYAEDWDLEQLWAALKQLYPVGIDHHDLLNTDAVGEPGELTREELLDALIADAERLTPSGKPSSRSWPARGAMRQLERNVLLNVIDRKWREHLYEMDYLKEGIGLRAMAQRDPLVEYQREGLRHVHRHDGRVEGGVGRLPVQRPGRGGAATGGGPVQTPQGLADLAAAAPTQQPPSRPGRARRAEAQGHRRRDSSRFTYSGPPRTVRPR